MGVGETERTVLGNGTVRVIRDLFDTRKEEEGNMRRVPLKG